jgi:uncharacterized coiled-coil protein SlyX
MLVKKLEFEISHLKEESKKHEVLIEKVKADGMALKEHGSLATVQVDKRVVKLEEEFAYMKRSLDDVRQTLARNEAATSDIQRSLTDIKNVMNTSVERRTGERRRK